jgi:hypothetical protein
MPTTELNEFKAEQIIAGYRNRNYTSERSNSCIIRTTNLIQARYSIHYKVIQSA